MSSPDDPDPQERSARRPRSGPWNPEWWDSRKYAYNPAWAQKTLDWMPASAVLTPNTPPAGSFLPYTPNRYFTGRDAELLRLATLLRDGTGSDSPPVIVLTGEPGVGKRQLAIETAWRCGPYFAGGVYWISLAVPEAAPVAVFTACLGMPDQVTPLTRLPDGEEVLDLHACLQRIRQAWERNLPRLLIFDGCADAALLEAWRPKVGAARVLVTAAPGFVPPPDVTTLAIKPLARADAATLLERLLGAPRTMPAALAAAARTAGTLEEIAAALGDLPLALTLAGSILGAHPDALTPQAYCDALLSADGLAQPLPGGAAEDASVASVVIRAFALNAARLDPADETDDLARELLTHAACFAPGIIIQRDVLTETLHRIIDLASASIHGLINQAYQRLENLGLLAAANNMGDVVLHPLLAQLVQRRWPDPDGLLNVELGIVHWATVRRHARAPHDMLPIAVHLRYLAARALARVDFPMTVLAAVIGKHLMQLREDAAAQACFEQALAAAVELYGENHRLAAINLKVLGRIRARQGDAAGAQAYAVRAAAIRQALAAAADDGEERA